MAEIISSLANGKVKNMRKLRERKYRDRTQSHLVEGVRAIEEGLAGQAHLVQLLYDHAQATQQSELAALVKTARSHHAELLPTTREVLGGFSSRDNPHAAIAVFAQRWQPLNTLTLDEKSVWITLESPRDPGNLGTIIRSCEAAGASGVILIDHACDPYSPEAMRASTGALFGVSLARASLDEFIEWQTNSGATLVGTGLERSTDYRAPDYTGPIIIAMGTERDGITPRLHAACGQIVRIPMRGNTDSLNLSIASALMLFEVTNRKYQD
ncbi:TrmH family RNA methyltransferase [Carnimonas nigrificans]|uniref:TrmH family RNA methyltransferase n=1 Tax=Carnimonas nigrificans TaxID=64323 RepID=UPI000471B40C|nr:RNA methyltransferase [Carnimonas nigrificans]